MKTSSTAVMLYHCDKLLWFLWLLDIRRRIELIQDFEMPIASTCVRVSANKQQIVASGEDYVKSYKCLNVMQLIDLIG